MKPSQITFVLALLLFSNFAFAQSVVGTWKRTSIIIEDAKGESKEMQQMMEKASPCSAKITYSFLASGAQKTNIPADAECQKILSKIAEFAADVKYQLAGSKITVFSNKKELYPDATYQLNFSGNTMTWLFDYASNPSTPNPTKAKKMKIVYTKI